MPANYITPSRVAAIAVVTGIVCIVLTYLFCIGQLDKINPDITIGVIFVFGLISAISGFSALFTVAYRCAKQKKSAQLVPAAKPELADDLSFVTSA